MQRICKNPLCRSEFDARPADVRRGWALYCSKSCKATVQESRTGQYKKHLEAVRVSQGGTPLNTFVERDFSF
jgi:hypothetical protein